MKRHHWGKPRAHPPGAVEVCDVCGATRVTAIPGYQKSPAMLNGKQQRYCPRPQAQQPLEGIAVGAVVKPSPPSLPAGAERRSSDG